MLCAVFAWDVDALVEAARAVEAFIVGDREVIAGFEVVRAEVALTVVARAVKARGVVKRVENVLATVVTAMVEDLTVALMVVD